ncbi:unnamed protein product, partial [marine sediment metagenome]
DLEDLTKEHGAAFLAKEHRAAFKDRDGNTHYIVKHFLAAKVNKDNRIIMAYNTINEEEGLVEEDTLLGLVGEMAPTDAETFFSVWKKVRSPKKMVPHMGREWPEELWASRIVGLSKEFTEGKYKTASEVPPEIWKKARWYQAAVNADEFRVGKFMTYKDLRPAFEAYSAWIKGEDGIQKVNPIVTAPTIQFGTGITARYLDCQTIPRNPKLAAIVEKARSSGILLTAGPENIKNRTLTGTGTVRRGVAKKRENLRELVEEIKNETDENKRAGLIQRF